MDFFLICGRHCRLTLKKRIFTKFNFSRYNFCKSVTCMKWSLFAAEQLSLNIPLLIALLRRWYCGRTFNKKWKNSRGDNLKKKKKTQECRIQFQLNMVIYYVSFSLRFLFFVLLFSLRSQLTTKIFCAKCLLYSVQKSIDQVKNIFTKSVYVSLLL